MPKDLSIAARVDNASVYILKRNPELATIPKNDLGEKISDFLQVIDSFEAFGEESKHHLQVSSEIAKEIGVIWDFSGPGTYGEPFKEDRYKQFPWAKRLDRKRLNHTAMLERAIIEAKGENDPLEPRTLGNIALRKMRLKDAIREKGPYIFYNGTSYENEVVRDVVLRKGMIIPKEKVIVAAEEVYNTIEQVTSFKLPDRIGMGGAIALVSSAPHLARIITLINHFKPFPDNTTVHLFPVPTPEEGKVQYSEMEISGLLTYTFIQGIAKLEPSYRHMLGKQEVVFP